MYVCKNCGQTHPSPVSFCNRCGSNAIENRAEGAPSYSTYGTTPTYSYGTPAPSGGGSVAPAIIGMIFSVIGLFISFFMVGFASELSDSLAYQFYSSYNPGDDFGYIFAFSIFLLPFS